MKIWDSVYICLKRDSNLGLSVSHRLNYEAAALTPQPPNHMSIKHVQPFDYKNIFQISNVFLTLVNLTFCFAPHLHFFTTISRQELQEPRWHLSEQTWIPRKRNRILCSFWITDKSECRYYLNTGVFSIQMVKSICYLDVAWATLPFHSCIHFSHWPTLTSVTPSNFF